MSTWYSPDSGRSSQYPRTKAELARIRIGVWFVLGTFATTVAVFTALSEYQSSPSFTGTQATLLAAAVLLAEAGAIFALRIQRVRAALSSIGRVIVLPLKAAAQLLRTSFRVIGTMLLYCIHNILPISVGVFASLLLHLRIDLAAAAIGGCIFVWSLLQSFEQRQTRMETAQREILERLRSLG